MTKTSTTTREKVVSPKTTAHSPKPRPLAEAPVMTLADVAKIERTSVRTTRRAVAAGLLEVLRVGLKGRLIRITPKAYAAYRQRLAARS